MEMLLLVAGLFVVANGQVNYAPVFDTVNTTGIDGDLRQRLVTQGVLESVAIGTELGKLKAHVPQNPNAVVLYEALSQQTLDVKQDGSVLLARPLDREAASSTGNNLKVIFVAYYITNQGVRLSADTSITITVLDVNDEVPTFQNLPYNAKVAENALIGTTLYSSILVRDLDVGYYSEIQLSCYVIPDNQESQSACDTFGLNTRQNSQGNYTGFVYLKRTVDYEVKKGYTMTIKSIDNPSRLGGGSQLSSTINILIEVIDQQDSPPRFLNTPVTVTVYENTPNGTRLGAITAQDGDEGSPRPIKIVNKDPSNLFLITPAESIDSSNLRYMSQIRVLGNIDRETQLARYDFDVEAIEMENGVETDQRVTTKVIVTILDEDDNIPKFEHPVYNVSVLEMDSSSSIANSTTPLPGLTVKVSDPDDASNALFNISILSQPVPGLFRVTPTQASQLAQASLIVTDAKQLDYENPNVRTQQILLLAQDVNNPINHSSTTTVIINLEDSNDNTPVFQASEYSASVREDRAVGSSIITITGSDRDSGENGRLEYSLRGTGLEKFNVNPSTGLVTLAQALDYEDTTSYQLLFRAQDKGSPSRESAVSLTISVLNYNDFGPIFSPDSYQTSVNEGETNILIPVIVKARDRESLDDITYTIVAGNTVDNAFILNSRTGVLSLSRGLNYEETPQRRGYFRLIVQATDADVPPQSANTTIDVLIIDKNNHDPQFLQSQYTAQISEGSAPGSFVKTVSATDQDFGSNGNISYYIWSGGLDHFTIDQQGQVTVSGGAALDVDNVRRYDITIHARDKGSPPRTGSTTLIVTLTDSNNKDPFFSKQVYIGSVQETVSIGTSVIQVRANDTDSTKSLQYSIDRLSIIAKSTDGTQIRTYYPYDFREAFEIEPTSGVIKVKSALSRDSAAEIDFNVIVKDVNAENNKEQTAKALVLITILGSADLTPYFAPPWTVTNPTYYYTLPEEVAIGTVTSTLIATDPKGPFQITNFQEVAEPNMGDVGDYFSVNQTTGQIKVNRRLDYENLNSKLVRFRVRAFSRDGTRSVDANITIQVQDINDNVPEFTQAKYTVTVSEDRVYPYQIATVFARDRDSGSYSEIEYSLSGQGFDKFMILKSGLILIGDGTILDHETTPEYNLLLTAQDNPSAQSSEVRQRSSVPLTIKVTDINDNPPVFSSSEYSFLTVESYDLNTNIGEVRATDLDSGVNGEIDYTIVSVEPAPRTPEEDYFGISSESGMLYSKNSLRGASAKSPYRLVIQAQDRGIPVLISSCIVNINVSSGQLDNGKPIWISPRFGDSNVVTIMNITEHADLGTAVIRALAVPRTPGASIEYSILSDNEDVSEFVIDKDTGIVTVARNRTLDREKQETHDLILLATDTLNRTLQSTRLLSIKLQDINDEDPSFKNCPDRQYDIPTETSVRESEPVGTVVYTARACDLDLSPYNSVQYSFFTDDSLYCFSNISQSFRVDASTGVITTNQVLDRESQGTYLICVQAKKPGTRRKRELPSKQELETKLQQYTGDDVLFLLVSVSDVNDNKPTFSLTSDYTYIFAYPTKDNVYQLTASDPDIGDKGRVRYSIIQSQYINTAKRRNISVFDAFKINTETGQISVGFQAYKYFIGGYFELTIKGEDYLRSEMYSTYKLKIYIGEKSSQVRVVMASDSSRNQQQFVDDLERSLNGSPDSVLYIPTDTRYHVTATGTSANQIDICFFVVRNNRVVDSYDGTAALGDVQSILTSKNVYSPGPCEPATTKTLEGWSAFWWVLVAFAIFMFVIIVILIFAVIVLYNDYKDSMQARTTVHIVH
ncbi:cadherin-23-like isoform X2 [Saccostrea echinata]|uniref:cadherin-23-like isoform X2 n=1 Tax=Saccostrea echinata TaxID=191078 RepID=UPI002A801EB7|nr:cadherin-23-like isoform X2 [Saccostrea echinata]